MKQRLPVEHPVDPNISSEVVALYDLIGDVQVFEAQNNLLVPRPTSAPHAMVMYFFALQPSDSPLLGYYKEAVGAASIQSNHLYSKLAHKLQLSPLIDERLKELSDDGLLALQLFCDQDYYAYYQITREIEGRKTAARDAEVRAWQARQDTANRRIAGIAALMSAVAGVAGAYIGGKIGADATMRAATMQLQQSSSTATKVAPTTTQKPLPSDAKKGNM